MNKGKFLQLYQEIEDRVANGEDRTLILADLNSRRCIASEEEEETILEVMDRVAGWCSPRVKL